MLNRMRSSRREPLPREPLRHKPLPCVKQLEEVTTRGRDLDSLRDQAERPAFLSSGVAPPAYPARATKHTVFEAGYPTGEVVLAEWSSGTVAHCLSLSFAQNGSLWRGTLESSAGGQPLHVEINEMRRLFASDAYGALISVDALVNAALQIQPDRPELPAMDNLAGSPSSPSPAPNPQIQP